MTGSADLFGALVYLHPTATDVAEGQEIVLNINRLGASNTNFTVDWALTGSGSFSPADVTQTTGTVSFTSGGPDFQRVRIGVVDDGAAESAEAFTATLSNVVETAQNPVSIGLGTASVAGVIAGSSGTGGGGGGGGGSSLTDPQQIALLYEVAFAREPDLPGLNFWINKVYTQDRRTVVNIADAFYNIDAFEQAIGQDPDTLSNAEIVEVFYANVLDRPGRAQDNDPLGYQFWLDQANNDLGRDRLMLEFAISQENVNNSPYVFDLAQGANGDWFFA